MRRRAFLEHHGPCALWFPFSHPHLSWCPLASQTVAHRTVCLCISSASTRESDGRQSATNAREKTHAPPTGLLRRTKDRHGHVDELLLPLSGMRPSCLRIKRWSSVTILPTLTMDGFGSPA